MAVVDLLDRLDRVRETGPGRWLACCPAHDDRSPSLSVRELDDGRTLIHCFSGCGAHDVLDALGLDFSALFPPRDPTTPRTRRAPPVPYHDVLRALRHEALVVLLCADAAVSKTLSDDDTARLALAVQRIETATRFADGRY